MNAYTTGAFEAKDVFEAARDSTKQFLTLSTGIIALTVTFGGNFLSTAHTFYRLAAIFAWLSFFLSVFFGLWTLLSLTGTASKEDSQVSIWSGNVRIPALGQVLTFLIGLFLTVIFGYGAAVSPPKTPISQGYRQTAEEHLVDVAKSMAGEAGLAFDADGDRSLRLVASSGLEDVLASWEESPSRTPSSLSTAVQQLDRAFTDFTEALVRKHQTLTPPPKGRRVTRKPPINGTEVRSAFVSFCPVWPIC